MTRTGTGRPKYLVIADSLRAQIESGRYPPGSQLPTHAALMEEYGVALNTARDALGELRKLGLVETFQGSGTFVLAQGPHEHTPEFSEVVAQLAEIREEVRQMRGRMDDLEELVGGRREGRQTGHLPSQPANGPRQPTRQA
jgi:DNA-binding GntR family transcriptional regulator